VAVVDSAEVVARSEIMRLGICGLLGRLGVTVRGGAPVVVAEPASLSDALGQGRPVVALGSGNPGADALLLRLGATAVVPPQQVALLPHAVRAAALGLSVVYPSLVETLMSGATARSRRLQERQLQVARLLLSGRSTAEMAAVLGVSPSTVKLELRRLYRQLGVRGRPQAAAALAAVGMGGHPLASGSRVDSGPT
jgi:DNA-binding NarL/FixJ family response regulator